MPTDQLWYAVKQDLLMFYEEYAIEFSKEWQATATQGTAPYIDITLEEPDSGTLTVMVSSSEQGQQGGTCIRTVYAEKVGASHFRFPLACPLEQQKPVTLKMYVKHQEKGKSWNTDFTWQLNPSGEAELIKKYVSWL